MRWHTYLLLCANLNHIVKPRRLNTPPCSPTLLPPQHQTRTWPRRVAPRTTATATTASPAAARDGRPSPTIASLPLRTLAARKTDCTSLDATPRRSSPPLLRLGRSLLLLVSWPIQIQWLTNSQLNNSAARRTEDFGARWWVESVVRKGVVLLLHFRPKCA